VISDKGTILEVIKRESFFVLHHILVGVVSQTVRAEEPELCGVWSE